MVSGHPLLFPASALACSCAAQAGSREEVVEGELSRSDAVFAGEVIETQEPSSPASSVDPETVTFAVSEVWKGEEAETLEVKTPVSEASCGYPFEPGESYLVYASTDAELVGSNGLQVGLCGETRPLADADEDLAVLGSGATPGSPGEPLPDTSGAAWMPSAAALSVAATAVAAVVLIARRLPGR